MAGVAGQAWCGRCRGTQRTRCETRRVIETIRTRVRPRQITGAVRVECKAALGPAWSQKLVTCRSLIESGTSDLS